MCFQPAGDPTVDAFACRDIDSYMLDREVFAVKVRNQGTRFNKLEPIR